MAGRVVHVVGTRPNYMKIAPLWRPLADAGVEQLLVHTGQHYDAELKDVFFRDLPLPAPDVQLGTGSGTHAEQTAAALVGLERAFAELAPDLVVVAGDVNSTLAGALAAAKLGIRVCHLEAGLRSFDASMPEEHNRRLTDHLSALLLTTCADANANLAREGIETGVALVGNTMIDSLLHALPAAEALEAWRAHGVERGRYLLVTLHRPSLVDDPGLLRETIDALATVASALPVVLPMHPRTRAQVERRRLPLPPELVVTPPLPYLDFLSLEAAAAAVLTDSGGIQEETTVLGVPCFTLRANTERPVTIEQGTNTLLGLAPQRILEVPRLLERRGGHRVPELWDGAAAGRAASEIVATLAGDDVRRAGRTRRTRRRPPTSARATRP